MRKEVRTAQAATKQNGLVWDFIVTLNSGLTNYTFRGDYTYYLSANVPLYKTNYLSGGTVLKCDENAGLVLMESNTMLVCNTSPFYPAVMTATTDASMGDYLGDDPNPYYHGGITSYSAVPWDFHDIKMKHANCGFLGYQTGRVSNVQFVRCNNATQCEFDGGILRFDNILANAIEGNLFYGGNNATIEVHHLTGRAINHLAESSTGDFVVYMTNSILYDVILAGEAPTYGDYVAFNPFVSGGIWGYSHSVSLDSWPFQTVLGGDLYLNSTNTSLRNTANTNITAQLRTELAQLTTYAPPLVLTNQIDYSQTWSPTVQRDYDVPDYGYHYSPIDYVISGCSLNTNVTISLTNSVVVAVDYGSSGWGFIFDTAQLVSCGAPNAPNRILRAHCLQENSTGNPGTRSLFYDKGDSGSHGNSEVHLRFTELTQMAEDGYSIYTGKYFSKFDITHSVLNYPVGIVVADNGNQVFGFTNNVIEWPQLNFDSGGTSSLIHLRNNLFRNSRLDLYNLTNTSTAMDNIFDTTDSFDHSHSISNGWNAYFATTNYLTAGVSNTNLVSLVYQSGALGKYYQATNSPLLNRGSLTNAGLIGLWHFTSTTNNVKETNSVLNIGNHYVATDASGNPLDGDADGWPDYYEDGNGNGLIESGETDWMDPNDLGLKVLITRPRNGSTIP